MKLHVITIKEGTYMIPTDCVANSVGALYGESKECGRLKAVLVVTFGNFQLLWSIFTRYRFVYSRDDDAHVYI